MKAIYLDHNATSPLRPCAQERWLALQEEAWANARSIHGPGVQARRALEAITEEIAEALGARPSEVIFTSGATESNHSAIQSLTQELHSGSPVRWAIGAGEHPSAHLALEELTRAGRATRRVVRLLPSGQVDLDDLEDALKSCDALCLQVANHETGALTDLKAVASQVQTHEVPWHADAVQAIGRIPFRFRDPVTEAITSASVSGHKFGGPGGVGVLLWRAGRPFHPLLPETEGEGRTRAGTPDVPGAGAMCQALKAATRELTEGRMEALKLLRDELEERLRELCPGAVIHGSAGARLPNTLSISLPAPQGGWPDGEELVVALAGRRLAVSTGAACASGLSEPSPVLTAMGVSSEIASASLRLSLGSQSAHSDLEEIVLRLQASLETLGDH